MGLRADGVDLDYVRRVSALTGVALIVVGPNGEHQIVVAPGANACVTVGNVLAYGLETPFTDPHNFLFNMYQPEGLRNRRAANDPEAELDDQPAGAGARPRRGQTPDLRYPTLRGRADVLPARRGSMRTAALSPRVRNFFPRSDNGFGAEMAPKLWLERS